MAAAAPAMTMCAAGMTEIAAVTVPAEVRSAVLRDAREYPRGMNVTADRAVPLPGTREEREDATVIPAFPVMSPAAAIRNKDYMGECGGLPMLWQAFAIPDFFEKGI